MDERMAAHIVDLLATQGARPRTEEQVLRSVGQHGLEPGDIRRTLDDLVFTGRVERTRKGAYRLARPEGTVTGRISVTRRGFGFVARPDGPDVYVSAQRMAGAMHGDTVEARLLRTSRWGGDSGEVVHVLERAHETLVGRYEKLGKIGQVVPADARINYCVVVGRHMRSGARTGDMVVVRIDRFPDGRRDPAGEIVQVIGHESDPNIEIEVIVRNHGLRTEFPPEVLEAAAAIPTDVIETDAVADGRRDYRDLLTCTIDGADAKDFDDAISIERDGDKFVLTVHIADVSHYTPLRGPIQQEAAVRGTSVYLVDRVLPMLPERLSNGICSLKPGVDRLAVSVRMIVWAGGSADHGGAKRDGAGGGQAEHLEIGPSIIRSDRRLTYEEVDEWIEKDAYPDETLRTYITDLLDLMHVLDRRRLERGSLEFETVEPQVILDEDGRPLDVKLRVPTPATKIIEEAMILTNETIAGFMHEHRSPMIYRIHDEPDAETIAELGVILDELNYPVKSLAGGDPRVYQAVIRFAHKRPEKLLINQLLLRSMKQAVYCPALSPHFGLASACYTHFTSPIRRYPDLVVHHLLKALLAHGKQAPGELFDDLEGVAELSSLAEREADEAERESETVKICELMQGHLGETFDGIVTGVVSFGLFVQLPNTVEGLVHIRDLTDDYYQHEPERFLLRGERSGRVYRLGQQLRVKLVNVVVGERRLDLLIEGIEPDRGGRRACRT